MTTPTYEQLKNALSYFEKYEIVPTEGMIAGCPDGAYQFLNGKWVKMIEDEDNEISE